MYTNNNHVTPASPLHHAFNMLGCISLSAATWLAEQFSPVDNKVTDGFIVDQGAFEKIACIEWQIIQDWRLLWKPGFKCNLQFGPTDFMSECFDILLPEGEIKCMCGVSTYTAENSEATHPQPSCVSDFHTL